MKAKVAKFIDKVRELIDVKFSKKQKSCKALKKALSELEARGKEIQKEKKKKVTKELIEECKTIKKQIIKAKRLIKEKVCD